MATQSSTPLAPVTPLPDPRGGDWRRLKASVRGALFGEKPPPTRIGRFTVLKRLGSGGMGIVYTAFDDELERKVAIKLLNAELDEGSEGRARLLREAQAMARLSHPNVISVFEVGTHEGDVFIAMEYVRGQTLRSWLGEDRRSVKQILDVFSQAGAGLSAAHAAGLVHRDFKPDNVMVGNDGRVRVLDFGLARPPQDDPDPTEISDDSNIRRGGLLDSPLTRDGTVVGTPAYMAPEQHAGEATDARSDQFSFCVALYEALYGERPYDGETLAELALAVSRGKRRPEPPRSGVPSWIREILLRGMAVEPDDRHRDMEALLATLHRDPATKRRRVFVALAGVAAIVGALGGGVMLGGATQPIAACGSPSEELEGVWDEGRRAALERAVTTSGLPQATDDWERLASRIDSYVGDWTEAHEEACVVPKAADEATLGQVSLARECVDWRLGELGGAIDLLLQADPDTVAAGGDLVRFLASPSLCGDPKNVTALVPPPADEQHREEAMAIRAALARAKLAIREERLGDARKEATGAVERARALSDRSMEAQALLVRQAIEHHAGDNRAAAATVREAALAAEAAGAERLYAFSALAAVEALTLGEYRVEEAEQWMRRAQATREQLGEDPELDHELAYVRGTFALMREDMTESLDSLQKALDIGEAVYGRQSPELLRTLNNYAVALRMNKDPETASHLLQRQREIVEAAFGDRSAHTAFALMNLGSTQMLNGDVDEAIALGREAVEIMDRVVDEGNPKRALAHMVYGKSLEHLDRMDEAIAEYQLAVRAADQGDFDVQAVRAFLALAGALGDAGRHEEAFRVLTRMAEIYEQQFSGLELARDRMYAQLLSMMALEAVLSGDPTESLSLARRSIDVSAGQEWSKFSRLAHYAHARALSDLGAPESEVQEAVKAALEAAPDLESDYDPKQIPPSVQRRMDSMTTWLESHR